ncbi:MAG: DUF2752 domain-containing protein [Pirellulaceae bacterium]
MRTDATMQSPPPVTADVMGPREADRVVVRAYRGDVHLHWVLLVLAASVLVVSLVLHVRGERRVVIPIVDVTLPGVCSYRQLLGIDCPGCGLTRCFISMAHGDIVRAWHYNPAGIYLFLVVLFQIPYRGFQLRRLRLGQHEYDMGWLAGVALGLLMVALLAQWVARVV